MTLSSRHLTFAAALISAGLVMSCGNTSKGAVDPRIVPTVPVATATRANLSDDVALTAEFVPYQEVDVMAKVAGYVRTIRVDIGDRVREGELLATLQVPEMENQLSRAAAAVKAAHADITTSEDRLKEAQAAFEIAHLSSTRLKDVANKESGLVPQQDLDVAHSRELEADAQLSAARSALEATKERSSEAEAEQAQLQTMFAYTNITAPFNGVVTKRYASVGSMIQSGISSQSQAMPLVRLSQQDLLRLILPVPVSDASQIHIGQTVDVNVTSAGRTFPGKVTRFAEDIQTATRTMNTEVDVPNPKLTLVPGMYAEVRLHLQERPDALTVPLDAIEGVGSASPQAYLVDKSNLVRIIPVKTGLETPNRIEILDGLHDGSLLIVGRHAGLKEGDRVDPKPAEYETDNSTQRTDK
jgi:RND family efflux transporter MFP subunit